MEIHQPDYVFDYAEFDGEVRFSAFLFYNLPMQVSFDITKSVRKRKRVFVKLRTWIRT